MTTIPAGKSIRCCIVALCVVLSAEMTRAQQTPSTKCGTTNRFMTSSTTTASTKVTAATARPDLQTSVLSPGKTFRIHFDTTGVNTPALITSSGERIDGSALAYVDSVGKIFDAVWQTEVTAFGFPAPPADHGIGGGDEYDIYIHQQESPAAFGYCDWVATELIPGAFTVPRYTTFIRVSNDFSRTRTRGIAGLKATAAHEFHHAIQVGCSGAWNDAEWYFYELCAEAMEPTVFPDVKDYVNDIGPYYSQIGNSSLYKQWTELDRGYDRAIWGIFLMKRYGVKMMRELWDAVSTMRPAAAMKRVLEKNGTSFEMEFAEFSYWNYFTGWRTDPLRYFPDARLFPTVTMREKATLYSTPLLFQYPGKGFTANYLQVARLADTAALIVANVNVAEALGSTFTEYGFQVRTSLSPFEGSTELSNGWSSRFTVSDPVNWIFRSVLPTTREVSTANICFPNPYRPSESPLFIGFDPSLIGPPQPLLSVYSASYQRFYQGTPQLRTFGGGLYAVWDGRSTSGEPPASGVYLYVLTFGETVVKGKFAVIR